MSPPVSGRRVSRSPPPRLHPPPPASTAAAQVEVSDITLVEEQRNRPDKHPDGPPDPHRLGVCMQRDAVEIWGAMGRDVGDPHRLGVCMQRGGSQPVSQSCTRPSSETGVRQPGQWCTRRSKADAAPTHTRGAHGGKVREA